MSLHLLDRPNNGLGFSTGWIAGTGASSRFDRAAAIVLFLTASAATLTIGFRKPLADYTFEFIVFVLAAFYCLAVRRMPIPVPSLLALATISTWGLFQLAFGATVYRYATIQASLRFAAFGATALVSSQVFRVQKTRAEFLRGFACFGVVVAVASVLAYFTSPGKIFWIFNAPYPDIWGSFLSRNNFAQFLELAMPVALWFALQDEVGARLYLCFAAIMMASGLASASRAGASILVLEAGFLLWIHRRSPKARHTALALGLGTMLFAAIPGIGNLIGRLAAPDPYQGRREIARSTISMISSRPWTGFGLGTFPVVYPEYALFDTGHEVDHAHNDWLEWGAEGGAGFAAAWIGLALWSAGPALRGGWGIGVLGCFLHSLVDYPFARFGITAWVFILLGMLGAAELREFRHRGH